VTPSIGVTTIWVDPEAARIVNAPAGPFQWRCSAGKPAVEITDGDEADIYARFLGFTIRWPRFCYRVHSRAAPEATENSERMAS